ncbi:MAG: hypothetical protein WC794_03920 [Candidatus Doudnabacteria bacterium]
MFLLVAGLLCGVEAWSWMHNPQTSIFILGTLFVAGPVYWVLFVWLWTKFDLTGQKALTAEHMARQIWPTGSDTSASSDLDIAALIARREATTGRRALPH